MTEQNEDQIVDAAVDKAVEAAEAPPTPPQPRRSPRLQHTIAMCGDIIDNDKMGTQRKTHLLLALIAQQQATLIDVLVALNSNTIAVAMRNEPQEGAGSGLLLPDYIARREGGN